MSSEEHKLRIRRDASSRMPLESSKVPDELAEILKSELERPSRYVELCVRSNFSFLRGGSSPEGLVRRARALGYDALALTDVNGLYGVVRAWEEAKRVGLRLVVGCELTVEFPDAPEGAPVLLLVRDFEGYVNLCRLLTLGHARKPKGECLVLMSELCTHTKGLELLLLDPYACPKVLREAYRDHIHLAVWLHKDGQDRARLERAFDVERAEHVPIVATNRVLFAKESDKALLDIMTCIREGKTLDEAGLLLVPNTEPALKSESAMEKLFAHHPEWVARSRRIADRCTFSLSEVRYDFPSSTTKDETPDARLRRLTYEGAKDRYMEGLPKTVEAQIEKELGIIQKIGVAPYFLSIQEVVNMARAKDILCQGRGSAANSAVCYCLRITAVDPARSNLLFERFLSEERKEPPDIDVDFEHERREEIIQAIYERYGRESAAMVSEVICYRGKSALREVGKVFGFSLDQLDQLASLVSFWDGASSLRAKDLQECGFDASDMRVQQVCRLAQRIEGFPRHLSIHVGGFVLSAKPLVNVAPVEPAAMEGRTVIPWDKDDIDALGFFKVDILGLGMLTALRKALDLVAQSKKPNEHLCDWTHLSAIDRLAAIPAEDPKVYEALGRADTVGVFQIESRAQMAMLPRLKPKEFYDLVVEVAIVRPGPIQGGMVHPYLRRRTGEEPVDYPHSCLKEILKRTLGVPLFQEQVMQIAIEGAGYSGGDADQLRRDMASWRKNGRLDQHRDRLAEGFRKRGISKVFADRLFSQIQGFGEYGFPESHASSFALLVYASAWIKVHHPAAFATSLINSQPMGFYSPATILEDAGRHGVEVEPICISKSMWDVMLNGEGGVRLGFRLIKGLPEQACERIVKARGENAFTSLEDLTARADLSQAELQLLAESGALQPLVSGSRRNAMWQARAPREGGLFAGLRLEPGREPKEGGETEDSSSALSANPAFAPLSVTEQLSLDYARTGVSVGMHPMRVARKGLIRNILTSSELLNVKKGKKVQVAGMVICRQRPMTASGVVFMTLEDEFGFINLVLWQRTFQKFRKVATTESLLVVSGKVDRADSSGIEVPMLAPGGAAADAGSIHVIVEDIAPLRLRSSRKKGARSSSLGNGTPEPASLPSMSRDFH